MLLAVRCEVELRSHSIPAVRSTVIVLLDFCIEKGKYRVAHDRAFGVALANNQMTAEKKFSFFSNEKIFVLKGWL